MSKRKGRIISDTPHGACIHCGSAIEECIKDPCTQSLEADENLFEHLQGAGFKHVGELFPGCTVLQGMSPDETVHAKHLKAAGLEVQESIPWTNPNIRPEYK